LLRDEANSNEVIVLIPQALAAVGRLPAATCRRQVSEDMFVVQRDDSGEALFLEGVLDGVKKVELLDACKCMNGLEYFNQVQGQFEIQFRR